MPEINFKTSGSFLSPLYAAFATASHKRVVSRIPCAVALSVPVISIGNITFGGTGKTPMAEFLARALVEKGFKPGIVLRGWRGKIDREKEPPSIISDGSRILRDWTESGDEAAMLAEDLIADKVPVAVGRNRELASKLLIDSADVNAIILDDGFQYTSLKRNFDIVLIDCINPFGSGSHPGALREPISSIGRAHAVVLTRVDSVDAERVEWIKSQLKKRVLNLPPVFEARINLNCLRNIGTGEKIELDFARGKKTHILLGIGNPDSFKSVPLDLHLGQHKISTFPDHHPYSRDDLVRVNNEAEKYSAEIILTTSKDAVRLNSLLDSFGIPVMALEINFFITPAQAFLDICTRNL
jgi:tetraacyldisaccharide 4'-kinase